MHITQNHRLCADFLFLIFHSYSRGRSIDRHAIKFATNCECMKRRSIVDSAFVQPRYVIDKQKKTKTESESAILLCLSENAKPHQLVLLINAENRVRISCARLYIFSFLGEPLIGCTSAYFNNRIVEVINAREFSSQISSYSHYNQIIK